jgi:hypothetical protein
MAELPNKLTDLVAEAVSEHGKATADVFRRLGRGERVDLVAETADRLAHLTRTAARFVLFWDNIATLLAEDPGGPITFTEPEPCAPGETQTFHLTLQSAGPPRLTSGLRRRGRGEDTIGIDKITVQAGDKGEISIVVDCSGQGRGLYEGSMEVVGAIGERAVRTYNVYIDPGAKSS